MLARRTGAHDRRTAAAILKTLGLGEATEAFEAVARYSASLPKQ